LTPVSLAQLLAEDPVAAATADGNLVQRDKQNLSSILREFGTDKWGTLLESAQASDTFTVADAVAWEIPPQQGMIICAEGRLYSANGRKAHEDRINAIADRLLTLAGDTTVLAELGAGYGAVLLDLIRRPEFRGHRGVARELTDTGRQLIDLLAGRQSSAVDTGACNLRDGTVERADALRGAAVYTSYSMHYSPRLSADVFIQLASYRPRIVVHFEPVYELHQGGTEWDRLICTYMERNDYTLNMLGAMRDAERQGHIRIVHAEPCVFGTNPLLPAACLAWSPTA
jgi:hypothetical protein